MSYEVELGVIIGKECKNVSVEKAMDFIGGICLGLDITAFPELVRVWKFQELLRSQNAQMAVY